MSNPIADLVARTEEYEATEAAETAARQAAERKQREADHLQQELVDFGHRFLMIIGDKVIKPHVPPVVGRNKRWNSSYMKMVGAYAEALLMHTDPKSVPTIDQRHSAEILRMFSYGLQLKAEHGVNVPEGFFYGQRLLAEQEAAREEQASSEEEASSNVIQLPLPAKAKGKKRRSA